MRDPERLSELHRLFDSKRAELLQQHRGRFALVGGGRIDLFDEPDEAIQVGYERWGEDGFIVSEVRERIVVFSGFCAPPPREP